MKKYEESKDKHWVINGKDSISDNNDIIFYRASSVNPKDTTEKS